MSIRANIHWSLLGLLILLGGCSVFSSNEPEMEKLSELELSEQKRLLDGASNRPSLKSLNLMPEGREIEEQVFSEQESISTLLDIPRLSLEQKRDEYEALLPLIEDETQKRQVAFRLADIKMSLAEQTLEEGGVKQDAFFNEAIEGYLSVINQHEVIMPDGDLALSDEQQALNRKLMDTTYQLSRALDLSGQQSQSVEVAKDFLATFSPEFYSLTEQHIELYFRIGEYYFNRQDYPTAGIYYGQVVDSAGQVSLQNTADFYGISAYMLGWSEFKQDNYNEALGAFNIMLAHTLGSSEQLAYETLDSISFLRKGEMRLVRDSLRVMALTFSYQGNADAIIEFYQVQGAQSYEHLVYEELAQQHLDDDRFQDSANVLLGFAQQYPAHPRAVEFYVRHIDAYILGGFPSEVLIAKQGFIETYSLGAGVVSRLFSPIGEDAAPYLRDYLTELAQSEHSIAQGIDGILQARTAARGSASNSSTSTSGFQTQQLSDGQRTLFAGASNTDLASLRTEAYEQAISYYANFIRTFDNVQMDSLGDVSLEVPERRFYMAEAHIAIEQYAQAISAFEIYAYEDSPNPMAVEAAYAAILAHAQLPAQAPAEQLAGQAYQPTAQQFSQQRFVETFAQDRRAPVISLNLMQSLFAQKQFEAAKTWATWLLETAPSMHSPDAQRQRSAMLVMAHSEFELANFASAEVFYRRLLSDEQADQLASASGSGDPMSNIDLIDRLAATLYRQAEGELASISLMPEDLAQQEDLQNLQLNAEQQAVIIRAIDFWQQIISDTPNASFRLAAQYDSASYYALLGQWQNAINTWLDFAQRYPQNELTQNIESQLLFAYQQTENWEAAAKILLAQHQASPNSDDGREALYQAASFYDRAKNRDLALENFRKYAHAYPQPLEMANEARFRMSEFYVESNEESKRRFWLNKLLQAQLELGSGQNASAGTPRSRYLAALSAMVFAKDADFVFTRIKLSQPLNKSLAQKQTALTSAINAYDLVMSFAVKDFTTSANYSLANLYLQLATDLMDSSRPDGLSALELSQYELLLEEQAYPFEETAIELHQNNANRVLSGIYDEYVQQSFSALSEALPARYNKPEMTARLTADDL
jgi:TolA-binding protein